VALRGGMGTVTEISLVWNKLQTKVLDRRPIVLIGDCWKQVVDCWQTSLVVSDEDVALLSFAKDAREAAEIIVKQTRAVRIS
jgi:predicted Rossmann-fold nucleotide-binding protein